MAKFKLLASKMLIVKGQLVSLPAGEIDTDDKDLIEVLKVAQNVEPVTAKSSKKSENSE
jgi:hypothetical protein